MRKIFLLSLAAFFLLSMVFLAGFLVGLMQGQSKTIEHRFADESTILKTVLKGDPQLANVTIEMDPENGSAYLSGEVASKDDRLRILTTARRLFGETRANDIAQGVVIRRPKN